MLPNSLLEMQDAAALLLGVTGNLQLETHSLLFFTVLLQRQHGTQDENTRVSTAETLLREGNHKLADDSSAHLASGLHV